MGREVRMVPPGWVHPVDDKGVPVPLYSGGFDVVHAEWVEADAKWSAGLVKDWSTGKWKPRDPEYAHTRYCDYDGKEPRRDDYMPTFAPGTATHLMMYENTSEGTPISPAFATPEELARWLADTGASAFGDMTATYEQWLATIRSGYAPSAVIRGGVLTSGVEDSARGAS